LFQIIERLRRRRIVTARALAEQLRVSERTIYRDISDLIQSKVPIEGAAGIGYSLPKGYDLPSLMFNEKELDAIVFGARMVRSWSVEELRRAADAALAKIEGVLPTHLQRLLEDRCLWAPLEMQKRTITFDLSAFAPHALGSDSLDPVTP
jgi:predicted DNA-binding transcriptional regulator YafY